jgi:hydrogenase expression/formation protein HypC
MVVPGDCASGAGRGILETSAALFPPRTHGRLIMCLGIPGRVVEIVNADFQIAKVDVAGVRRAVNVGLVWDEGVAVGDWVLIHVGFALSKIDEAEAKRTAEFLEGLGDVYTDELRQITESRIE